MRMRERLRRGERGAVTLLVALGLVVLIGMLALTADLGRMVGIRRELVRGADAAALAAAQQCAMTNGSVAARAAAVELTEANRSEASLVAFDADPACDGAASAGDKLVTVRVSETVDMFFADILGIDEREVAAEATALWSVPGIIPISVNAVPLEACEEGETCLIEYPKEELNEPRWGILDLAVWNQDVSHCPVSNAEIVDILLSGGVPRPNPSKAFDCIDNGVQFSSWDTLVDGTWWFPVIDVTVSKGEVVPGGGGATCTGADIPELQLEGKDCRITQAWVYDFVRLKVLDVRIVPGTGGTIELTVERVPGRGGRGGIEIRLVD